LLNGSAASLSLAQELGHDKVLYREQRGIDLALKILSDQQLAARAAEAVSWAEAHTDQFRSMYREITLAATRIEALERGASELLGQCPDVFAVQLPMMNLVGRSVSEIPLADLQEAALAQGVVTKSEIRKAETC
jgi:hypothetical protein